MEAAERLTEALRAAYPGWSPAARPSGNDWRSPPRTARRIRSALETVATGASAGTAGLTCTQYLPHALGL